MKMLMSIKMGNFRVKYLKFFYLPDSSISISSSSSSVSVLPTPIPETGPRKADSYSSFFAFPYFLSSLINSNFNSFFFII